MASLQKADIPLSPGVYAVYRGDKRMYVGKAKCLQDRVWGNHSGRGVGMGSSALRRNVAEHLGIAKAKDIKDDPHRITPEQAKRVPCPHSAASSGCWARLEPARPPERLMLRD